MKTVTILFLGASKRTSLLERFIHAGKKLDVNLKLLSCELDDQFYPISHLATIIKAPLFKEKNFAEFLDNIILKFSANLIIPTIDPAVAGLSNYITNYRDAKKDICVVSKSELCRTMEDKILAEKFFTSHKIPTPPNTPHSYPKIIKHKCGSASKQITKVWSKKEEDLFFERHDINNYIIQDFIEGRETTVDIYVSKIKGLVGYVLRDRLQVAAGEVMDCITRIPSNKEKYLIEQIASLKGWIGPITLQYITDQRGNIFVVEINPRFGGGATASIEAGLDMPYYLLAEHLGRNFEKPQKIKLLKMARARRDFFYEL